MSNRTCATCAKVGTCFYSSTKVLECTQHELKAESNYERLFGTPERAARTICRQLKHYNICICDGCPVKPPNKECDSEYDALLEWLRGDAE